MADLQIIGGSPSNFVWVTRILCTEKGVPYQHVQALPHTPEVDAIHPFGKIPVMRHGDVTLCESRAICRYIDSVFDGPSLMPSEPVIIAASSERTSPKRLSVTMTSNCFGLRISCIAQLSARMCSSLTSGA